MSFVFKVHHDCVKCFGETKVMFRSICCSGKDHIDCYIHTDFLVQVQHGQDAHIGDSIGQYLAINLIRERVAWIKKVSSREFP